MKTATVTFHAADNFGAFLQAYALQQTLNSQLNTDNSIIDFRSPVLTEKYSVIRPIKSSRELFHNIISLMHYRKHIRRHKRYESIRKAHLLMTKRCTTEQEAIDCAKDFDVLISGSDQVWNPHLADFSPVYFLRNMKGRKVAYSVSMGSKPRLSSAQSFADEISDFSHISVREHSAKEVVRELYGKEVDITADPTLLLSSDQYNALYDPTPIVKGKYIFFYSILTEKQTIKAVKRISAKYRLPVVTVFTNSRAIICDLCGIKVYYDAGPAEFLNLLKNAELVATNSFHGMIFSVIFHKEFFFLCNRKADVGCGDARIDDFLLPMGINRFICPDDEPTPSPEPIEWERVEQHLEKIRAESLDYLKYALKLI